MAAVAVQPRLARESEGLNVLVLNMGADTGGVLRSISQAFRSQAGWSVRSMVSKINYIGYPVDVPWTIENVREAWLEAEVVHLHHDFRAAQWITGGYTGRRLPDRPYVIHHHGTGFRESPDPHLAELMGYGAVGVVATLDLWLIAPELLEWLPCPIDVDAMQAMRNTVTDEKIRIAHAPTNRTVKSTEAFLAAMKQLEREYPVEAVLIERQPWDECLRLKSTADIYFDQVKLGYGNNAIEAWGMGIPVVAGGADPTLDEMERRFGVLPFYHATEETIYEALRELVESPELRQKMADRGLQHVRRYHDERVVVEQLKEIYLRAAGVKERAA